MHKFIKGLLALIITIFFQTEVGAEYLYKDEIIHNDKFAQNIETLGSELFDKTGVALKLVMLKEVPQNQTIEVYEKELLSEFSKPTIVLMFSELDKNVNIWTSDVSLYKYFNKNQVLSPVASPVQAFFISVLFARSFDDIKELMSNSGGSILPLLGNKVKGDQTGKYSAAMYNGYLDISMQVASAHDLTLDNGVSESSQYPLMIIKTLFYGFLLYALFLYLRNKFKKKGADDE
ncbi:3-dehydroquinate dehydratase [Sulfurimonas sp. SAG-AH-194-C21]|nr:3-dehydroquinate dehydratase [Sulfurimonas sp. SAG-AH-194-C21]MDF1882934.1 3-dehydroquinate dehydratase [Sulfurimonas sp. SAG-AH-194-C21]